MSPRAAAKLFPRRTLEELVALQSSVQELARHRNTALRLFLTSRGSTTYVAQREFWLEYSWLDQEYRVAVHRLAKFCLEHRDEPARTWSVL
jgi:hypothetical protein